MAEEGSQGRAHGAPPLEPSGLEKRSPSRGGGDDRGCHRDCHRALCGARRAYWLLLPGAARRALAPGYLLPRLQRW